MKDYAVSSWDSIRRAISSVPWRHPYWRVNPLLGERCWVGTWHTGQVTARPIPEPTPSIPLVPIDHWLDATAPLPIFQCAECPFTRNFQTAGILVRHYQDMHWRVSRIPDVTGPEQDAVDKAYWEEKTRHRLVFSECGKAFHRADTLANHIEAQHSVGPKRHPCPENGCGKSFREASLLRAHIAVKHQGRRFECEMCSSSFSNKQKLNAYAKKMHSGVPPPVYRCAKDGCSRMFASQKSLDRHVNAEHLGIRVACPEPGCGKTFSDKKFLKRHAKAKHSDDPPPRIP